MKTSTAFRPLRDVRSAKPKKQNGTIASLTFALIALGASVYSIAASPHSTGVAGYLAVATSTIVPGRAISAVQIKIEEVTSTTPLAAQSPAQALSKVVGAESSSVITKGSIVTPNVLFQPRGGSADRILSFALPMSHAADGLISAGDRIDILANEGSGSNQVTVALARGVKVVAVDIPTSSISTPIDPNVTVTVALPTSMATMMVVNGLTSNSLYLVLSDRATAPNDSGLYIPSLG